VRSLDVISCHVTATCCELQNCRSSNVLETWLTGLLQPLPGNFRLNDITSGSLPVTWGHVTSFPVTWLPPPTSYSLVWAQTYPKLDLQASTATSRWLPVKWRHFRIASCYMRSRDVISCHLTAICCELQTCRSSNVLETWLTGLLQPLQCNFLSYDVNSGRLAVTWGHMTSFPVTWLPPTTSYSTVGAQTYPKVDLQAFYATSRWLPLKWRHVQVTSGHMKSCDVISSHVTATSCELQPCRSTNVLKTWLIGLLLPLQGDFRSRETT